MLQQLHTLDEKSLKTGSDTLIVSCNPKREADVFMPNGGLASLIEVVKTTTDGLLRLSSLACSLQ